MNRSNLVFRKLYTLFLGFLLLGLACPAMAQVVPLEPLPDDPFPEEPYVLEPAKVQEIHDRLMGFVNELNRVKREADRSINEMQITKAERKLSAIDIRWNVYYQVLQKTIASENRLVAIVTGYQQRKEEINTLIQSKRHYIESLKQFNEAEKFILAQDTVYERLYQQAMEYSLVSQLGPQLEQLKGQEQLLFADIQNFYNAAKTVSDEFNGLQFKMKRIDDHFVQLKNRSEQIQACEYKPLFERIKEYLFGLAAVALILMFANMIQSKIQMAKQAKEALKKQQEMMNMQNNDYPSI